jgi:hypothetical protein
MCWFWLPGGGSGGDSNAGEILSYVLEPGIGIRFHLCFTVLDRHQTVTFRRQAVPAAKAWVSDSV